MQMKLLLKIRYYEASSNCESSSKHVIINLLLDFLIRKIYIERYFNCSL